jgi:hypothetical protein
MQGDTFFTDSESWLEKAREWPNFLQRKGRLASPIFTWLETTYSQ